jgi:hypothetical protein
VAYERRYQAERYWTLRLRKTCDLLNISDGAAPLTRPPLSEAHRAKIRAAALARNRRLRGGELSPAAAA